MGNKTTKSASKELEEVTDEFISHVSSWKKPNYEEIKTNFEKDLKQYLNKTQKDVRISKTVAGSSSLAGSAVGTVGGILLFTPLAPAGIIVGLVGLGISGVGILVEGGAETANYFVGKNVTKKLKNQLKHEANIDIDAFQKIMGKINCLLKSYKHDTDVNTYDNNESFDSVNDQKNIFTTATDESKKSIERETLNGHNENTYKTAESLVSNHMVTRWLTKELLKKNADISVTVQDKLYNLIASKTDKSSLKVKENLQLFQLLGNIGFKVGNNVRAITQDSIFVASESFSFLSQASDDVLVNLVKGGTIVANNADEAVLAANVSSKIGSTASKVFTGLGIAGGIFGVIFSSYSLHKTTKALKNQSPSEKAKFIDSIFLNIDSGFSLRETVENMCSDDMWK